MGASGSAFDLHEEADSVATPGQKSIVSDEVPGIEASALLEAMKKFVKDEKTKMGMEAEFKVEETSDGIVTKSTFKVPEIFGGGQFSSYGVYKVDAAKLEMNVEVYMSEVKWEQKQANLRNTYKMLQDPVRIEYWQDVTDTRMSGKLQKTFLEKALTGLGVTTSLEFDTKSPDDPSKLSVLTGPIEGAPLDADTYLDAYMQWLVDSQGATMLPDGSVIEEQAVEVDVLGLTTTTYCKQVLNKEENKVYIYHYGSDQDLIDLVGTAHVKVHKDPFRIEQWYEQKPGRRCGKEQKNMAKPFVDGVLKSLEEKAS